MNKLSVDSYTTTQTGVICHCSTIGNTKEKHVKTVSFGDYTSHILNNDLEPEEIKDTLGTLSDIINNREQRTTIAIPTFNQPVIRA